MKKQFNISAKDAFKTSKTDELLLVISMSVIYTVITALTEYRSVLSSPSDERYSLTDAVKKLFRSYWFRQFGQLYTSAERCRGL